MRLSLGDALLAVCPNLTVRAEMALDGVESYAAFSPCERYRYLLARRWEPAKQSLVVVMLNPSTADERQNDPTVSRMVQRAYSGQYGGLIVLNLYAWRSKDPRELRIRPGHDPVGPDNDAVFWFVFPPGIERHVVCGWGAQAEPSRVAAFRDLIAKTNARTFCLGRNMDGSPKHPLYVTYRQHAEPFDV